VRLYTEQECEEWLSRRERRKPDAMPEIQTVHISYPPTPHRIYYFADWIAHTLCYRMDALLWITEWGIWGSSENWHLYYKVRQSYGDFRLIHEAPGHLFLPYETEDLTSLLQLAMLNGWGGYILTAANYVNVFFSHDEYLRFFASEEENLTEVRKELGAPNLPQTATIGDT
jgi:hypothetical protein